jgi:hypothetical protein
MIRGAGALMKFKSFTDYYPFYLKQHANLKCRRLHFVGTCSVLSIFILFFFTGELFLLGLLPVVGYGFAWTGHLVFEGNRPVTFKHPIYSLMGDFRMFWDILSGKLHAF